MSEKKRFIVWLSEISKKDIKLAGGKGASLGEMYNAKFPVPQAFIVTTDAYNYILEKSKIEKQIDEILTSIDTDNTADLTQKAKQIRELITNAEMPEDLEKEIIEAYDNFNVDLEAMKSSPDALAIMKSAREPIFVSVRSSATAEDLGDASFAGQQESFINIKGNQELIEHVKRVFASAFTARAIFYRKKKGFDANVPIAAIVQKMINSDKSGVIFSKHPVDHENIFIEAVFGQGEGIVSGKINPDAYLVNDELEILKEKIANKKIAIIRDATGITKSTQLTEERAKQKVLKNYEIKQLAEYALKLEKHYKKPQDIEFAIEGSEIFILQSRPVTTMGKKTEAQDLQGELLTKGLAASPGIGSGIVRIVHDISELDKIKKGDILVTSMTNPDMVVSMQKAAAIVTDEGGITSHAAIVSREMGIPAVVGTENATSVLEDGMEVSVDGFKGNVFKGKAESKSVEILPIVDTKIKIKVLVDLPDFAERAAKTQADGVGLTRIEGIIASEGKHPLWYKKNNTLEDYKNMLKQGIETIAENFVGKEIWIRTSDIRSDEYANLKGAPKDIEKNPMLGNHGIRFSLKHPDIFKAELRAVEELAAKGHKFGLMFPQVISPEEVKQAKKIMQEIGMNTVRTGVMIETPASVILIKDICEVGIDFISFGTNDLTQYTLAIDRGNEDVQYLYNELDWSVKKQLSRVIRMCKQYKVETSICGQAGSKKEMVEFLVKQGIDSISVNADVAKEISEFVRNLESGRKEKSSSSELLGDAKGGWVGPQKEQLPTENKESSSNQEHEKGELGGHSQEKQTTQMPTSDSDQSQKESSEAPQRPEATNNETDSSTNKEINREEENQEQPPEPKKPKEYFDIFS